ncbi:MAG: pyridoxal phosphate-dependent aminotransferase, partial [Paracoccaceae bacterium]
MSRFLTLHAASLPASVPFVGPETQERAMGRPFRARLGANESLFGPSPTAISEMQRAVEDVWMYADPENHDLKQALALHHGTTPDHIVVAGGIDTLLGLLCRLTVQAGTPVVTSLGAYPTFAFHVAGFGGALTRVPYLGNHEDPQALLDAATKTDAKLLYLSNPDNPM